MILLGTRYDTYHIRSTTHCDVLTYAKKYGPSTSMLCIHTSLQHHTTTHNTMRFVVNSSSHISLAPLSYPLSFLSPLLAPLLSPLLFRSFLALLSPPPTYGVDERWVALNHMFPPHRVRFTCFVGSTPACAPSSPSPGSPHPCG